MATDLEKQKLKLRLLRRLAVVMVICPSFVGLTSISNDDQNVPHTQIRRVQDRIVIPGSLSYLDLDPKF